MKPELFIGSSTESLNIVNALTEKLQYNFNITPWDSGVFSISGTNLDDLLSQLNFSDFAIFVFSPDDQAFVKKKESSVVRDNVLYELGLYTGKLGRKNTFYLVPNPAPVNFHLPTDLAGISPGKYDSTRMDNLPAAVSPFCSQLIRQVFQNPLFFLNGKWNFRWLVDSSDYPKENNENAFIFHYEEMVKGVYTANDGSTYVFNGKIKGPYIQGFWENKLGGATYHGTFQVVIQPSAKELKGIWTGWSKDGKIKSGECGWTKIK